MSGDRGHPRAIRLLPFAAATRVSDRRIQPVCARNSVSFSTLSVRRVRPAQGPAWRAQRSQSSQTVRTVSIDQGSTAPSA